MILNVNDLIDNPHYVDASPPDLLKYVQKENPDVEIIDHPFDCQLQLIFKQALQRMWWTDKRTIIITPFKPWQDNWNLIVDHARGIWLYFGYNNETLAVVVLNTDLPEYSIREDRIGQYYGYRIK